MANSMCHQLQESVCSCQERYASSRTRTTIREVKKSIVQHYHKIDSPSLFSAHPSWPVHMVMHSPLRTLFRVNFLFIAFTVPSADSVSKQQSCIPFNSSHNCQFSSNAGATHRCSSYYLPPHLYIPDLSFNDCAIHTPPISLFWHHSMPPKSSASPTQFLLQIHPLHLLLPLCCPQGPHSIFMLVWLLAPSLSLVYAPPLIY